MKDTSAEEVKMVADLKSWVNVKERITAVDLRYSMTLIALAIYLTKNGWVKKEK